MHFCLFDADMQYAIYSNGFFQKKTHTPPTDGILEILAGGGGGSKTLEIQAGGGLN